MIVTDEQRKKPFLGSVGLENRDATALGEVSAQTGKIVDPIRDMVKHVDDQYEVDGRIGKPRIVRATEHDLDPRIAGETLS